MSKPTHSISHKTDRETRSRILVLANEGKSCDAIDILSDQFEIVRVDSLDQALSELKRGQFNLVISQASDFLALVPSEVVEQAAVILETVGQAVAILGLDGKIIWGNRQLNDLPKTLSKQLSDQCIEIFGNDISSAKLSTGGRRFSLQSTNGEYFEITASPVIGSDGKIQNIAIAIWDATASRQLQQKINAIDNAGKELVKLETEAVEKLDIPHRLSLLEETIIRYTREVLGFDKFSVCLLDNKTNRLELVLSSGLTSEAKNVDIFASPEGNGISGYVASTGRSYICSAVEHDRRYMCGIDNAASSLTVPLFLHDQVIGVFNIESETPAAFKEDDRQFAEIFGRYVAIALHILDLLVVERYRTTGQLANDVRTEISGPLNDILVEATSLMEEYIGQDDMRHRLQSICDKVATIRQSIKHVTQSPNRLIGQKPSKPVNDPVLADKRVLVADDEPIIRQTILDILEKHGCVADLAEDGTKAIELLANNKYDLVLSDIKMPHRSGYEIFAAAKDSKPDIPVVFMTGFGYDPNHSIIRARQEGLSGVLYKPFKVDELLIVLREAIRETSKQ